MVPRRRTLVLTVALALAFPACGGSSDGSGPTSPAGLAADRPASTAELSIVAPRTGQVIEGSKVELRVKLEGAKIVPATTTNIVPDEGHLHVLLDDRLISMTQGVDQVIRDVAPGEHRITVEFVASDHAPFDPRVVSVVAFEQKR
jgi:hypothetical protein